MPWVYLEWLFSIHLAKFLGSVHLPRWRETSNQGFSGNGTLLPFGHSGSSKRRKLLRLLHRILAKNCVLQIVRPLWPTVRNSETYSIGWFLFNGIERNRLHQEFSREPSALSSPYLFLIHFPKVQNIWRRPWVSDTYPDTNARNSNFIQLIFDAICTDNVHRSLIIHVLEIRGCQVAGADDLVLELANHNKIPIWHDFQTTILPCRRQSQVFYTFQRS